jgi:hypothetical protein
MDVRVVRLPRELKAPVEVVLSPETRAVRVELPVAPGPPSFDAVVRTNEGARVWSAESLEPPLAGAPLAVTVPAEVFASDRYVLVVQAEPLRGSAAPRALEYTLRVRRER